MTGRDGKLSTNALRAGEILLLLGETSRGGMTLAELAERLGESKSVVHRALGALAQRGFVDQAGRRSAYRLGPAVFALANRSHEIVELVEAVRPALIAISAQTGLSSYLMARSGLDSVCLDYEIGSAPVQALFEGIGGRLPLGVGLGGVAVLSRMAEKSREVILALNANRYAEWHVGAAAIRAEIAMLAEYGYAVGRRASRGGELVNIAFPASGAGIPLGAAAGISLIAPGDVDAAQVESIVEIVRRCLG